MNQEKDNMNLLKRILNDASNKKSRIILKNGFTYLTSKITLEGDFVEFFDIRNVKRVVEIFAISGVEVLE